MEEQEIHLRDYWRVVAKRRYTVYTFFLITFTVVLIGTFTATPIYQASTKVLIEKNVNEPLMGRYYYDSFDPDFLETQNQLITSYKVARKVVDILELDRHPEKVFGEGEGAGSGPGPVDRLMGWLRGLFPTGGGPAAGMEPGGDAGEKRSPAEELAGMISGGLSVAQEGGSRVVTISYRSPNPVLARDVVNTVAQAYRDEILEIRMSSTGYTIDWMTRKAEEERKKLERSEEKLQEYMREKDIVTVEDRIAIIPQKLSEFSVQLTRAETRRKELEAVMEKIDQVLAAGGDPATIPAVTDSQAIRSLREKIVKAEQNINELSKKYGEKHPAMIQARSDLAGLEAELAQETERAVASIRNEYELARSNEENLRKLLAGTKDEAISLNEKFIQYGILKREVESNRLLYDALIQKIKEQGVTEQSQNVTVWILEEADIPSFPVKPRRNMNLLLGAVLGLFGGVGLAFFIEYLDNTVKSPEDVEDRLGLTVLGVIQRFKPGDGERIEEAVQSDTMSVFAESYKAVRSAVLLSSADHPPKTILISSAAVKEGKTTTAANLAMTIAQADKKVLLVDADLRRPAVGRFFGIDNFKGLSTYLCGISDSEIVVSLPDKNLDVIPSGPIPPNPSELLSSDRMPELLDGLAGRYDFIVFDSPPILHVTDSLVLSKLVEGTILVAKFGETTYEMLDKAVDALRDIKGHVIGMVINAVDLRKGKYYDYGYYYTAYYTTDPSEEFRT